MQQLRRLLVAATFLIMLTACSEATAVTPTPFPQPAATFAVDTTRPIPVPITDLAANPAFYNNVYIQLSGQLDRLPRLVCSGRTYRSPATWGLVRSDFLARARGFESQLFALAPEGLLLTVNGYWRQWDGPMGCGKQAVAGTIWYLDVVEIVSPSPLVAATLTPGGDSVADLPPTSPVGTVPATEPADTSLPTATAIGNGSTSATSTPAPSPTDFSGGLRTPTPPGAAGATATPTATDDDEDIGITRTPSATPTTAATSSTPGTPTNTPTATATGGSNGASTATPGGLSPTNTPGASASTPVDMGALDIGGEVFAVELLDEGEYHLWTLDLFDTDWVTVYAIGEPGLDMSITLTGPNGNLLVTRNNAGDSQVEALVEFPISGNGDYELRVESASGGSGYYVINAQDDFAFPAIFQELLTYGSSRTASLPAVTDNYWFFSPTPGDEVTITTDSLDGDIFFYVYDANGNELDYVESQSGVTTTTLNITSDGLFTIYLGDQDFEIANYTISLTEDN